MDCRLRVFSEYANEDDAIGGAVITGTVIFEWVAARIEDVPTEMSILLQGIITNQGYMVSMYPGNLLIENNYYVAVMYPTKHELYNKLLRVVQVTRTSSSRTSRGHLELVVDLVHENH